jgi:hypothetical protein
LRARTATLIATLIAILERCRHTPVPDAPAAYIGSEASYWRDGYNACEADILALAGEGGERGNQA